MNAGNRTRTAKGTRPEAKAGERSQPFAEIALHEMSLEAEQCRRNGRERIEERETEGHPWYGTSGWSPAPLWECEGGPRIDQDVFSRSIPHPLDTRVRGVPERSGHRCAQQQCRAQRCTSTALNRHDSCCSGWMQILQGTAPETRRVTRGAVKLFWHQRVIRPGPGQLHYVQQSSSCRELRRPV